MDRICVKKAGECVCEVSSQEGADGQGAANTVEKSSFSSSSSLSLLVSPIDYSIASEWLLSSKSLRYTMILEGGAAVTKTVL